MKKIAPFFLIIVAVILSLFIYQSVMDNKQEEAVLFPLTNSELKTISIDTNGNEYVIANQALTDFIFDELQIETSSLLTQDAVVKDTIQLTFNESVSFQYFKDETNQYYLQQEDGHLFKANQVNYLLPLDQLLDDYSMEDAKSDHLTVFVHDEHENFEVMTSFLEMIEENQAAFIRYGSLTIEGDLILTDIYFTEAITDAQIDTTRDTFSASPKIESYQFEHLSVADHLEYSYLIGYDGEFEASMIEDNQVTILARVR